MKSDGDKIFLVTGASSGIGYAIALLLNAAGATVIANGRDLARLEEMRLKSQYPANIYCEARDLGKDLSGLRGWLRNLAKKYGPLDGMVSSAGQTWNSPLAFYPLAKVYNIFDICCHAPLLMGSAFCDKNVNAGQGSSIVYVAAAAAQDPNPGQGVYAAAKAALIAGAKCLAREAAPKGIRVNCVSPGLVRTPMMAAACAELGSDFLKKEEALYPLGIGEPEDVANLAIFLLSAKSRWITGQNFSITGGR